MIDRIKHIALVLLISVSFAAGLNLLGVNTASVYAADECPTGQEVGDGSNDKANEKKCYECPTDRSKGCTEKGDVQEPKDTDKDKQDETGTSTTCAVEKVGWLVCPITEWAAKISDRLFSWLARDFLYIEPELVSSSDANGTRQAWDMFRNLANVMFIIAFLVVIYSQVSGAGISNYGVKRMLPRLILAAIAVNVSYYICQGMVDLSNILGYEIKEGLVKIAQEVSNRNVLAAAGNQTVDTVTGDGALSYLTVIILGGAAIVWVALGLLGATVSFILITCITIIIILLLRKAFIVLLVVVSPVAFVMYLLPNTERLFNKWLSMFWKLLMVFPIVALLLGGGQLASAIILKAGTKSANDPQIQNTGYKFVEKEGCINLAEIENRQKAGGTPPADAGDPSDPECTSGGPGIMVSLVAAGIAVAPLLAVWSVLQGALAAAGAIGGRIAGAVQKGAGASVGKGADWASKNTALGRGMAARKAIKQNYKDQKFAKKMSGNTWTGRPTRTMARGIGGNVGMLAREAASRTNDPRYSRAINAVTGGVQAQDSKLNANFAGAAAKIEKEEVASAHILTDKLDEGRAVSQAQQLIQGGNFDSPHLAALLEHIAKLNQSAFMGLATQITSRPVKGGSTSSRAIAGAMSESGLYGGGDIAQVANGQSAMNLKTKAIENLEQSGVSSNNLAKMSNNQIEHLGKLTATNPTARRNVKMAYSRMSADQKGNLNQGKIDTLDRL